MFYYAIIDDSNVCYDLYPSDTQITDQYYVEITQQQFEEQSVVNMQWNPVTQEWQTPFYFIGTTDEVNYQGSSLTSKLNSIDEAIEGKADEAHTHSQSDITGLVTALSDKANTSDLHLHDNKSVLDEISAEKVNAWDNKAEANHNHEQYATTEKINEAISESVYVHPETHSAEMITGLADVATTGSYNDLEDLPVIPTVPTSLPANGGNADTVDNKHADDFATADHNHDSEYADISHSHTQYAQSTHAHAQSDITGLESALSGKANATHSHTEYASNTDVEALETAINGKANASHTHSNYASVEDVSNLQTAINGKANATHSHTEYAVANHTHSQYASNADVEALETEVSAKADANHTHANYVTTETYTSGMSGKSDTSHTHTLDGITDTTTYVKMTPAERTKLSGVETGANKTVVDSALSSTSTNPVQNKVINTALSGKANSSHTHTLDDVSETTDKKILTATERTKLSGIAEGANKTIVDSALSSTSTNPVQNNVVNTALGNKVDKVSGKGLSTNDYTTAEKTKLAGIAEGANAYTHPSTHPASMISGLATVATSGSYNDLSNKPTIPTIPSSLPANGGNADTVDGKHSTDFAPATHTHPMSAVVGLLDVLLTDSEGGVNYNASSGDMLNVIKGWNKGIFTAYFAGGANGCTNTPKTSESWRCMVHKTGALFGWVLAFGTSGSVFTNYLDNGTWRGWKALFDVNPAPLWGTNGYYMTAGHTVTPTKKLSECQHGWVLIWSDFDKTTATANDKDFCTTVIPKVTPAGATWSNKLFYCDLPRYIGDNTSDIDTERRIIKQIYISDNKIVGHDSNNLDERHDVVLRAVYEY